MTIENLIAVIPRPNEAPYAYDDSWDYIELGIGTPLPHDYKELMRLYGAGRFLEFIDIYGPRSPSPEGRLDNVRAVARATFIQAMQGSLFFDDPPLPIWPRPGGLMACGQTWRGDYIFWLTRGLVPEWPIVIWDRANYRLETFECDLTDFISGVAAGDIQSDLFPGRWVGSENASAFKPASLPWAQVDPVE